MLGPNNTEELSTEGSQVGSGEGSIVGDWVIGKDEVGPTDGTTEVSIGCEVDKVVGRDTGSVNGVDEGYTIKFVEEGKIVEG